MPSPPPSEAEKIQYTVTASLRVNDGKIISGMLKKFTDSTAEMRVEMRVQVKHQQAEHSEHYGVELSRRGVVVEWAEICFKESEIRH